MRNNVHAVTLVAIAILSSFSCSHRVGGADASPTKNPLRIVLVTGATGSQGGATARALLSRGYAVRALTRHPESEKAQALAALGATLVKGDLNDPDSLRAAVEGVDGVFSVQDFWEHGREGEIRQGISLANAAQAAGVKLFVYSSVGGADRALDVPHFASKLEIEKHVRKLSIPWAILRPVSFMENWEGSQRQQISAGMLMSPLNPATRFQQIAVTVVGSFAAEAFDHPHAWTGKTLEIAGDDRSMAEVVAAFSKAIGKPVNYAQVPWDKFDAAAGSEMTAMFRWFESDGYHADVSRLRRRYSFVTSFDAYLARNGWK